VESRQRKVTSDRALRERVLQSGVFDIDLEAGELYRNGRKIALQEQPFRVLASLLADPGALVTREALQAELWGDYPLIDAEQGLNTAIRKLRSAFRDDAENPRFIETVPKRGYRFIAPVRQPNSEEASPVAPGNAAPNEALAASAGPTFEPQETSDDQRAGPLPHSARVSSAIRLAVVSAILRGKPAWLGACLLLAGAAGLFAASIPMIPSSNSTAQASAAGIVKLGTPGHPTGGIGGYDLKSPEDRAFAFDYDHSGKLDHLVLYRPGEGMIWILRHINDRFRPVYEGGGAGNYSLISGGADQAFAFDYDHSGKPDHLVLYRRGAGMLSIFKNEGRGLFTPVYQAVSDGGAAPTDGPPVLADQVIAFDYDHSGKPDHLLFYRSGQGVVGVWTNVGGKLSPVAVRAAERVEQTPALSTTEHAFAFDYDHSGKLDHLVVFRPGDGGVVILKNATGTFTPVYGSRGLGGYDLKSPSDQMLAIDYDGSGRLDHLLLYRPGAGVASILENTSGTFNPVYQGQGYAGYDLMSVSDRALAFDFDSSGKPDHLMFYRPGTGVARVIHLR
jgi:DNA-binding winged helix-turn-helix (wHTH) protein